MRYSQKNPKIHSHLMKQPSFKHSLMAALVISLGGTSLATWAGENVTTTAAPLTTNTPATGIAKYCTDRAEFHAKHEQDKTQRRTEAFQQADTNKDGKVNLTEWLAFMPHHRGTADGQRTDRPNDRQENHPEQRSQHSGKNLVEWLQKVDTNHDGQISKAEAESYAPRLAKHFAEIDADHNGLISQDELKASHDARKAQWQARSLKNRTEDFAKADVNHDGQLTLTEWLAFKPQHHGFWHHLWHRWFGDHDKQSRYDNDNDQQQGHRGQLFKKVDINGDGKISLSEAQANAPRLAEHFNEIDTDHDGQISQDERRVAFKSACAKAQS